MLSLHQLRTFLEVVQTGSVREAADRLIVSQPAVSSALASLQRTLGVAVVERDGRGLRITAAGERLATYGRQVFALLDEAVADVRAAAGGASAVRLAAVTTAAEQLLPALLAGFESRPLAAAVELHVANRDAVWDRLAHGEADLAIGGRPPDERFVSRAVRPNQLVVVASAQAGVDESTLGAATWLVREPGSGTRATTEALFEALGITPTTVTIGSNGAILGCVRVGLGVSLLSRDALARDLSAGIVEIPTARTPLVRDWHIVALVGREPTIGAQRFLDHVVETGAFERA
jgi:LysR family transcriptional regulator, low CO2-responsive transcriptional regulator